MHTLLEWTRCSDKMPGARAYSLASDIERAAIGLTYLIDEHGDGEFVPDLAKRIAIARMDQALDLLNHQKEALEVYLWRGIGI